MHPIQNSDEPDTREPRRTPRIKQSDRFDVLVAASEATDICPIWVTDILADPERAHR